MGGGGAVQQLPTGAPLLSVPAPLMTRQGSTQPFLGIPDLPRSVPRLPEWTSWCRLSAGVLAQGWTLWSWAGDAQGLGSQLVTLLSQSTC